MKKFMKRNWFRILNILLVISLVMIGWLRYGKKIMDMFDFGDIDQLNDKRRHDEERVNSSLDRIDGITGRAEDIEREIKERSDRVSAASEEVTKRGDALDETLGAVSEFSSRVEDRIARNKELIQRLQ